MEDENQQLKILVADLSLYKEMLQEVLKQEFEAGSETTDDAFSADRCDGIASASDSEAH